MCKHTTAYKRKRLLPTVLYKHASCEILPYDISLRSRHSKNFFLSFENQFELCAQGDCSPQMKHFSGSACATRHLPATFITKVLNRDIKSPTDLQRPADKNVIRLTGHLFWKRLHVHVWHLHQRLHQKNLITDFRSS